jgi:ATP-dependent DNA helicase PIF1
MPMSTSAAAASSLRNQHTQTDVTGSSWHVPMALVPTLVPTLKVDNVDAKEEKEDDVAPAGNPPPLSAAQEALVVSILRHPKRNFFITGGAGTGKSVVLRALFERLVAKYSARVKKYDERTVTMTASTGIAAVNIDGVTIYSFSGIGVCNVADTAHDVYERMKKHARTNLRKVRTLIIDEVSMISARVLDILNRVMRLVYGTDGAGKNAERMPSNEPFGGVQIVMCGDFAQLAPVPSDLPPPPNEKPGTKRKCAKEPVVYCFDSDAWKRADIVVVELEQVLRQDNPSFVAMLAAIRRGEVTKEARAMFAQRNVHVCGFPKPDDDGMVPLHLYCGNKKADAVNAQKLHALGTNTRVFTAIDVGQDPYLEALKRDCPAKKTVELAVGALVMLVRNEPLTMLDEATGFPTPTDGPRVNGSRGRVVSFDEDGMPVVHFDDGVVKPIGCVEFTTEIRTKVWDEPKKKFVSTTLVVAMRKQVPLRLAWAITTHKSQGMSLERAVIDVGDAFDDGQVYVALSRVRSMEGLTILNMDTNKIRANAGVLAFYAKKREVLPVLGPEDDADDDDVVVEEASDDEEEEEEDMAEEKKVEEDSDSEDEVALPPPRKRTRVRVPVVSDSDDDSEDDDDVEEEEEEEEEEEGSAMDDVSEGDDEPPAKHRKT